MTKPLITLLMLLKRRLMNHFQSQDPQEAYTLFSNTLKKQYNMCFPKIKITGTYRNRLPWLTDGLRASIKMKNRLYKLSKSTS